ncbi:RtcB family protein [Candidatus Woesearchaeota archaeon]|nr:RtcB family protein [Candidatus Woesearchaeota archaeon]
MDMKKLIPKETSKNKYVMEVHGEMRVPGIIYANQNILSQLTEDIKQGKEWNALRQIYNVACLPGLEKASIAMPDVHPGYGFCIGGVGAFNTEEGVISVAGVGFDINCGVRTIVLPIKRSDISKEDLTKLADELYKKIPAGLGKKGKLELTESEIDELLVKGSEFVIERGYGFKDDLKHTEEEGKVKGADPNNVSKMAKQRQFKQVGTLGSGNHYLELQEISEVYDEKIAKAYGLEKGQLIVSIHCGSRALGHQIGTDYLKELEEAAKKYNIPIREKELVCAPFQSEEGQKYFSAVNAGVNCAFANRQVISHLTRQVINEVLGIGEEEIKTLYGVGHNTCKLEIHNVDGEKKEVLVHRKGATRGFGPGREEVPEKYRKVGQPIIIGGSMGTESYILAGTEKGMEESFGSVCHGAGRVKSRFQAKNDYKSETILEQLTNKGILIRAHSMKGLVEEAPQVYKDVTEVINVMSDVGLAKKVVQMKPVIVIKG